MPPPLILDPATVDLSRLLADQEGIRRHNSQRFHMEHLSAVVLLDEGTQLIIGYKDVRPDEFWVPGHMPGYPILPGVLICEAAAQLCSFYIGHTGFMPGVMGFGGMENVRFRRPVVPGDRLLLIARAVRLRKRQAQFAVQGFVNNVMVFHGDIIGITLKMDDTGAEED